MPQLSASYFSTPLQAPQVARPPWPVCLTPFQACRSYGFDPFGLGQVPSNLQRFQEAELVHCRWAMLGAAGALAPELLGFGDWYSAPQWVRT